MNRFVPVNSEKDIFPQYQETPIGRLLEYYNLNRSLEDTYQKAELLRVSDYRVENTC
ncbi:hypothetical protein [Tepidibacillus sp. LV47]|uniref:hypothetical protein n=1 Tax=Tepidibacillus sp. LV47 TaxID=3398228 RepID=UPI003AB0670B